MRAGLMGAAALVASLAGNVPALAQSPLDGPLVSPDAPAPAPAPHSTKAKPKKIRHAAAKPVAPSDGTTPPAHIPAADAAPASSGAPADPLDLGMKWNGNNDNAAQTRSQNLDGNAFGTGAEVGMKLHF